MNLIWIPSVKDTNNLLTHNQWTSGDYTNDLTDFTRIQSSKITNQYSTIGESSINLNRIDNTWWINVPANLSTTGDYTFSIDILNKSDSVALRFQANGSAVTTLNIPTSDSWQTYSISASLTNLTNVYLQILNYTYDGIYIDNIRLIKN